MTSQIIIIDHDHPSIEQLISKLRSLGYGNTLVADSAQMARHQIVQHRFIDVALITTDMPDMDGLAMLDFIKNTSPGTECVMVTAANDARIALECLKKGAFDYLVKPVAKEVLDIALAKALERKRLLDILELQKRNTCPVLNHPEPFASILTHSESMQRLLKEAELHAAGDQPILITGESGTGKELLAWAIHRASARAGYPFIPINMASVSADLFEAEFFKPSSKVVGETMHFLEHTHKGTLFLDEIGDLPLTLQGKLLRLMQEGAFSRVDSNDRIVIDLRVIAATHEDLDALIARNAFRKDLYYTIRGNWLHLPPLRHRMDDLPLLADNFLKNYLPRSRPRERISQSALKILNGYGWPGNIRELKSVLQTAAMATSGQRVEISDLPSSVRGPANRALESEVGAENHPALKIQPLAEIEKAHILHVYHALDQNKVQTAKALGVGLNTLRRKLASYGER
jgi:DNA-binding NtrC family response regulator